MEMSLNVRRYMGVTRKSGDELHSHVEYSMKGRYPGLRKIDQQRITVVDLAMDQTKTCTMEVK